jgi:DNA transformation protein
MSGFIFVAPSIAQPRHLSQSRNVMAFSKSYRDFVVEQLGRVAPVTARSMFGGVGLYTEELFFALIDEDRLYFKVDDSTRPDFERLGMEPFRPFGEVNAMGYCEVPADVLEDADRLGPWMKQAIGVAARAEQAKPKRHRRS